MKFRARKEPPEVYNFLEDHLTCGGKRQTKSPDGNNLIEFQDDLERQPKRSKIASCFGETCRPDANWVAKTNGFSAWNVSGIFVLFCAIVCLCMVKFIRRQVMTGPCGPKNTSLQCE